MVTTYNQHGPIYPPEAEACTIRGAPGMFKCKWPPGKWLADQSTCASKPPGPVLKYLYKPRNGIALRPPVESRPGGATKIYYSAYDSITRGSPCMKELLIGYIIPARLHKNRGGRIIPTKEIAKTTND